MVVQTSNRRMWNRENKNAAQIGLANIQLLVNHSVFKQLRKNKEATFVMEQVSQQAKKIRILQKSATTTTT